ncbi:MAG: MYXO-CTERM sorting domain-containing protein [Myxococcales bacterium]|nr:MYXO-CTERM sorting domain-containing protein [Myxococcales bacterium]
MNRFIHPRLALLCAALFVLTFTSTASAVTAPYFENFDAQPACTSGCSSTCALNGGWVNDTTDDSDWGADAAGTSSLDTGPSVDHTTGSGQYLYTETSSPCTVVGVYNVISPDLDVTGLSAPGAQFWYHMFGADIGSLHVDILDTSNVVIAADVIPVVTGPQGDVWLQSQIIDLVPFIGQIVRVRIRYVHSGTGFEGDAAIDDFEFRDFSATDVGVASIDSPTSGCSLGNETVTATLQNFSGVAQSNIPVQLVVDGGSPIVETFTGSIPPFATVPFSFSAAAAIGAGGSHTISVTTQMPGDVDNSNDNVTSSIYNAVVKTGANLDTLDGPGAAFEWIVTGTSPTWALGTPSDTLINAPFSAPNAFKTALNGNYNVNEQSAVETLCGYDLTGLTSPAVRVKVWWELDDDASDGDDGVALQASTDGGNTWTTIGTQGSGLNWYTSDTLASLPGGFPNGWAGDDTAGSMTWVEAVHDLSAFSGQTQVLFRFALGSTPLTTDEGFAFDNFEIFDNSVESVQITGLLGDAAPALGAIPPKATAVVAQILDLTSYGSSTKELSTITVTNLGNEADANMTWELYLDDGNGILEAGVDTLIDSQAQSGGAATFNGGGNLLLPPLNPTRLFVTAQAGVGATSGNTFQASIVNPTSDIVFVGSPAVTTLGTFTGASLTIGEQITTLPFFDDFSTVDPAIRSVEGANVPFPEAANPGQPVTLSTVNTVAGQNQLVSTFQTLNPTDDTQFLQMNSLVTGTSATAVQYSFDLSAYSVANDPLFLAFRFADDGQGTNNGDGVFVSTDGGATWEAQIYKFTWGTDEIWEDVSFDLSQALALEGLEYTDNVVIRFQTHNTSTTGEGFIDWVGLGSSPKMELISPNMTVVPDEGTDMIGNFPALPQSVSYQIANVGDFPMEYYGAIPFGPSNVSNITLTPPMQTNPPQTFIDGGQMAPLGIDFTPGEGPFSFGIQIQVFDTSLGDFKYNIIIEGVGDPAEGDIQITDADGMDVPDGGAVSLGSVDGGVEQTLTYTITNTGLVDLDINQVGTTGLANVNALITLAPPMSLQPNESAGFVVSYTPIDPGPFSFSIVVTSNDPDESPYIFNLGGTVIDPNTGTGGMGAGGDPGTGGMGGEPSTGGQGGDDTPADDGGCGCRVPGGSDGEEMNGAWALLLLGLAFGRRRRRAQA